MKLSASAKAAFGKSIAKKASLALGNQRVEGEAIGLTRMRGAFLVEIGLLKPDPTQPRKVFEPEKLADLAASIRQRGIRQPIRVRRDEADGRYMIIAGERRYRASIEAGLTEMPCILADERTSAKREVLIDQVIENWQRADLEPVELHYALVRLRDEEGMTQDEIVKETGKSKSEVSRFLSLAKVDPDIMEEARTDATGKLNRTTLEALAKVPKEDQKTLVKKVREGALSAKAVDREARRLKQRSQGKRVGRAPGATRRFVVGSATVEVMFRKREATNEEVAEVLSRAAVLAKQENSE
jgi:ParB family chromosome partitioning protein